MEDNNKSVDVNSNNENNNINNTKKKSKVGLIIGIVIGVFVLIMIIVGVIGYMIYQKNQQQLEILTNEINKLSKSKLTTYSDIDMDIKSEGDYGIVEKTIKDYFKEAIELKEKGTDEIIDTNELAEILSIDNIKKDGPDFIKTKAKIDEMKKSATEYYDKLIEICSESNMSEAIQNKGLSEYYVTIYNKLMFDDETSNKLEKEIEKIEGFKETVAKYFDWTKKVFNYLSENKDYWSVSNEIIEFNNTSKLTEYNKIIDERPQIDDEISQ